MPPPTPPTKPPESLPPDRPELPLDLLAALAQLDTPAGLAQLLDDLLTPAEVRSVGERWAIVKRIAAGESQRAVRDALQVSITTVNRGAKQYRDGSGGFDLAFDTLQRAGFTDPRPTRGPAAAKPRRPEEASPSTED